MSGCRSRIAARGPQALVGVRRRHPDVDDRDVRPVGADLAQEVLGVAGLADDLQPDSSRSRATPSRSSTESSARTTRMAPASPTGIR